jgi:hypothetical protein
MSRNLGALTSWKPVGLFRPVMGQHFLAYKFVKYIIKNWLGVFKSLYLNTKVTSVVNNSLGWVNWGRRSMPLIDILRAVPSWSCSKAAWHIPLLSVEWINCWWWTEELPETCRVPWQNKFVKLVHLFCFITKKFVRMRHGHVKVQKITQIIFIALPLYLCWDVPSRAPTQLRKLVIHQLYILRVIGNGVRRGFV